MTLSNYEDLRAELLSSHTLNFTTGGSQRGRHPGASSFIGALLLSLSVGVFGHEGSGSNGGAGARLSTPEGMSIAITSPDEGAQFNAGEPVVVHIRSEGMDTAGDHWHLYLNGEMEAMVGGGRTSYQLDPSALEAGEHRISVTISNAAHKEYDLEPTRMIYITDGAR